MGLYHVGPNGQVYVKDIHGIMGRKGRYVKEHRFVMAKKLGRTLRRDEYVIHEDGNQLNNDPSNLRVVNSKEIGRIFGSNNGKKDRKNVKFIDSIILSMVVEKMREQGDLGCPLDWR